MTRRLNDQIVVRDAVAVSAGGGAAAVVATKIDATGYSRARFTFKMGAAASTGSLSTGLGVWKAATSGATYALIISAAAITSGVLSGGASNIVVIDVPTDSANAWLQLSGSFVSTTPAHSAIVELYGGVNRQNDTGPNQVIIA